MQFDRACSDFKRFPCRDANCQSDSKTFHQKAQQIRDLSLRHLMRIPLKTRFS